MHCPRCSSRMQNVVEYVTDSKVFLYTKEYYCSECKCCVIERFDKKGFAGSEWIDFNV